MGRVGRIGRGISRRDFLKRFGIAVGALVALSPADRASPRSTSTTYSPGQTPLVMIPTVAGGGTARDLVIAEAAPPFRTLKVYGEMFESNVLCLYAQRGDRCVVFSGGMDASWLAKVDLETLEAKKIFMAGPIRGQAGGSFAITPDYKYLYVPHNGLLSKIDTEEDKVVKIIRLHGFGHGEGWSWKWSRPSAGGGVKLSPDGRFLYYLGAPDPEEGLTGIVIKLATATDQMMEFLQIDTARREFAHMNTAMGPDGKLLFVSSLRESMTWIIDVEKMELENVIAEGAGRHQAFTQPDGQYVWCPNDGRFPGEYPQMKDTRRSVWIYDAKTAREVKKLLGPDGEELPQDPHHVTFTPDSRYAALDARYSDLVIIYDAQKLEEIKRIPVGRRAEGKPLLEPIPDNSGSWHPRLSPDGRYTYIPIGYLGTAQVVDNLAEKVVHTYRPGVGRVHQLYLYWPGYEQQLSGWWTNVMPKSVPNSVNL